MASTTRGKHPSGDQILNILSAVDGPTGEFVQTYPGKAASEVSTDWLDEWFRSRVLFFLEDISRDTTESIQAENPLKGLTARQDAIVKKPVRMIYIEPHYFRGFCSLNESVCLIGDLVVIDGRNSSGKTSLAEAIEWLVTGELLRRRMQQHGAPRELENCICNQLKPDDEETWVEAEFATDDGKKFKLKRVLKKDYGTTHTSTPESVLFYDNKELTPWEEETLLDELFAGSPPILMQHSLGLFVRSNPAERRIYFERLLRLDELTHLIEKAVVGDSRLSEFSSPSGSVAWTKWEHMKTASHEATSRSALKRAEQDQTGALNTSIAESLILVARTEFADIVSSDTTLDDIRATIAEEQKKKRQQAFPILGKLRPPRALDNQLRSSFSSESITNEHQQVRSAYSALCLAQEAAKSVEDSQIVVAQAFGQLSQAGIILETTDPQTCPLCNYNEIPTLTTERIHEISSWLPIQQAVKQAKDVFIARVAALSTSISSLSRARASLIPESPSDEEWAASLDEIGKPVEDAAKKLRQVLDESAQTLEPFDTICTELQQALKKSGLKDEDLTQVRSSLDALLPTLNLVINTAQRYANAFADLDKAVGALTREDPLYSLRESWLSVANDLESTAADIRWEQAKAKAQTELQSIRSFLLSARQEFLDQRRTTFNEDITSVWKELREDRYSAFSRLFIPPPRGRGFPVEIEVKAILDNNEEQREVDALKVFSESQINVLGIAAFVTRAKALGQRTLLLDDPVQSMDEEHFKSFASKLIPYLLDKGFQVILLTHNDTFAREISYACCNLDEYVTMKIRHSRREGCQIDEGNRRVAERLKQAEKKGENGELVDAWRLVRLSLERLYTVAYKKYGPADFQPLSWQDQAAESMWNSGAGQVIEAKAAGIGTRLKEILDMSVAGAHDKAPQGFTDLTHAIHDIRALLGTLRLGAG